MWLLQHWVYQSKQKRGRRTIFFFFEGNSGALEPLLSESRTHTKKMADNLIIHNEMLLPSCLFVFIFMLIMWNVFRLPLKIWPGTMDESQPVTNCSAFTVIYIFIHTFSSCCFLRFICQLSGLSQGRIAVAVDRSKKYCTSKI